MGCRLTVVGCLLLSLGVVAAVPNGPVQPAVSGAGAALGVDAGTASQTGGDAPPVNPDSVHLRVTVHENGTADWRVEYRTPLDDPEAEAAFEEFRRDHRNGTAAANEAFYDRIRASIDSAENATGREMTGRDFETATTVRQLPEPYGVVVYSFTWEGFATTSGDRITVGDALTGFFLNEDEELLITWPDAYELAEVRPTADVREPGTVGWTGPTSFGPGEPRVVVTGGGLPPVADIAAAVAVLAALAAAAAWVHRRRGGLPRPSLPLTGEADDGRELLSNEEQVLDLLEERGGRAKQQEVAEELGWTKTKTSYVVSNLREEGRIHSFRLGRENVLSLSEPNEPDGGRTGSG